MICPDKIDTTQWLAVHDAADRAGLRSNVTMMFGHVDAPGDWARHLIRARDQQQRSGGFTEFMPLPFVHMEAPIWRRGRARSGPTLAETLLVHATARLVNDLGGTLMNESISRAAGARHGQEMPPERLDALIRSVGRSPRQRTTLYGDPPATQVQRSYRAPALTEPHSVPVGAAGLRAPQQPLRPHPARGTRR